MGSKTVLLLQDIIISGFAFQYRYDLNLIVVIGNKHESNEIMCKTKEND